ncbi:MAG: helix-turn-helix transcriptional regulator [Clostridiales bacterium]|nr:helix-turn-helix transcriptional regulator [Clostridiales bacterium]
MDKSYVQLRIARIRTAHNISARKVSIALGQSTEYINQIESGKALPSLEGLFNICDYFNISLGEFFDDRFEFPIEYTHIIEELNKMDSIAVNQVYELLKLINK